MNIFLYPTPSKNMVEQHALRVGGQGEQEKEKN